MDRYSFNGIQFSSSAVDIEDVGELRVGADRFRAIYTPKDAVAKDDLEKQVPCGAIFSNLRVLSTESGATSRVRARGEVDQVVEVSDKVVVLEGSIKTFQLEPR